MNIVGFGDSFIHAINEEHEMYNFVYMTLVGKHFGVKTESRGIPGSGPWNMFFDFLNYKKPIDVAVMAWSESSRLYHREVYDINIPNALKITEGPDAEIYNAARLFYKFLFDSEKQNYEQTALMCMFDQIIAKQYPDTKFIHLHGFPLDNSNWKNKHFTSTDKFYYDFQNSVEIRPSLIYLSQQEGWEENLNRETRINHLSVKYHIMLSKAIIHGIENFNHGEKIDVYGFA